MHMPCSFSASMASKPWINMRFSAHTHIHTCIAYLSLELTSRLAHVTCPSAQAASGHFVTLSPLTKPLHCLLDLYLASSFPNGGRKTQLNRSARVANWSRAQSGSAMQSTAMRCQLPYPFLKWWEHHKLARREDILQ